MEYHGDGAWSFLGERIRSPAQAAPRHYSEAPRRQLRSWIEKRDAEAIYEAGRRDERSLEVQLRQIAAGPEWTSFPSPDPRKDGVSGSLEFLKRVAFFECRIAALAVLARWRDKKAEEALYSGALLMPGLSARFVPALAFVNSKRALEIIELYGDERGRWNCAPDSNRELKCKWGRSA